MDNLTKKTFIKGMVVTLVLSAGIATTANAEVTRISGADRYATSDAIVKAGWPTGAKEAVLTSGIDANTVDALTVAPFAKAKNAPIVLVNPEDSVETIVSKFTALNVKTVYIANGTGVISTQVDAGLKAAGIATVTRLGGINRYETALNIAKALGNSNSIVVASGDDAHLVDSLSIAPIAAAKGMPIFLAGGSLDAATTDYINSLKAKTTYVLGGTDTVADEVVSALPGVNRLAGSGRYETNAKVVDTFKADSALNLNNIFIASGEDENLVDALAGSPLAGSKGAPIIFAHDIINPDVNTVLKSLVTGTTKITELGGVGAVTAAAEDAINKIQINIINGTTDNDTVITFQDKIFEKVVRDMIGKPTGDILKGDVNKITELKSLENISNLSGIENFTKLTRLDLYISQGGEDMGKDTLPLNIDALKGCTNLTYLSLIGTKTRNLDALKDLTNLTYLNLNYNGITNIDALKGLTNLTYLDLGNNGISNIDALKGLTNLTTLSLSRNRIINIDVLKALTNLTRLYIERIQVSNIDAIKGLTNLTDLDLNDNEISNIDALKGLTSLTKLSLGRNQISNTDVLKGLTNLTFLSLGNNGINNIDALKGLTSLNTLYLGGNQISNIDALKSLTSLTTLELSGNQISNIDGLKGLTSLTTLYLGANQISNIDALKGLTNLTSLYLGGNKITDYSPTSSYYKNLKYPDFTLQ